MGTTPPTCSGHNLILPGSRPQDAPVQATTATRRLPDSATQKATMPTYPSAA